MSLCISIRFLTGRAHLHHWHAHHSDGKVDWPPAPWRLLRALVAVAGTGLTSLPAPLDESISDIADDALPVSRLASVLAILAAPPTIWLPQTSGGHTRQFLPTAFKSTGSAVFDSFATVSKETPIAFEWSEVNLDEGVEQFTDLEALLRRLTYFGRAESWCEANAHASLPAGVKPGVSHWSCVALEPGTKPSGLREHVDYTLERKLAPEFPLETCLREQAVGMLSGCDFRVFEMKPVKKTGKPPEKWVKAKPAQLEAFKRNLAAEPAGVSLLRCLLRSSGEDITSGLERPIGSRWVQYTVPRAIYRVPESTPRRSAVPPADALRITLIRFALNTTTINRAVLPSMTDTLLVADKFRSAALAWHGYLAKSGQYPVGTHPRNLCGREEDGSRVVGNDHAFFWPRDEDGDGLLDHVTVFCPSGLAADEVDSLRRLLRLKQRGGRPDLLVTPVFMGQREQFWPQERARTFISATPYFCPLHLTHGKGRSGRSRSIERYVLDSLRATLHQPDDTADPAIEEIRYLPGESTPKLQRPDEPPLSGSLSGFWADGETRFIRALAFCRRRRNHEVKGPGKCFKITFTEPRPSVPFAIGDQAHFGLGLFIPAETA